MTARFVSVFDLSHLSFPAITSQPGTPEATAVGKEHVIIEWLKPESDGGSEIKNYIVDKREKSSTRWEQLLKLTERFKFSLSVKVILIASLSQYLICFLNGPDGQG